MGLKCQNLKFQDRHHGLFVGFAPMRDPLIAVAVIAEHGCHGGETAAPVARAVVKTYLEKYYPELYGEKAIIARLKANGQPLSFPQPSAELKAAIKASDDDEDEVGNADNPAVVPETTVPPPAPPLALPAGSTMPAVPSREAQGELTGESEE
jgi:hypothetical protein